MGSPRYSNVFTEMIVLCQGKNESTLQRDFPSKLKVLALSCVIGIPQPNEAPALLRTFALGSGRAFECQETSFGTGC
jgi:hypothetical protein